jgi:hypothetical protein
MTTEELRRATQEFDEEFVSERAEALSPLARAGWERAQAQESRAENGAGEQTITVRLEKALLDRCTALAKRKRLSRDTLIARGLRALLAAEGED